MKQSSFQMTDMFQMNQFKQGELILFVHNQMKYKESGKKEWMNSLYSTLPETLETQRAKEATQLQSQVTRSSVTPHEPVQRWERDL